jgi:hypothetical protein
MHFRLLVRFHLRPIWPPVRPPKCNLYFEISSATALSEPALYILQTFHVPNLMSIFFSRRPFFQGIRPGPKLLENFRNKFIFYGEEFLVVRPIPKLEDRPLSAVRDCLVSIFAATLQNWRESPPSATWGRAMPWWQGTHLTWVPFAMQQILEELDAIKLRWDCTLLHPRR